MRPSSSLPLLRQATTFRSFTRHATIALPARCFHASPARQADNNDTARCRKDDDHVPFDLAPDQMRPKINPTMEDLGTTTITSGEQQVFEEIFRDIRKRQQKWSQSQTPFTFPPRVEPLGVQEDIDRLEGEDDAQQSQLNRERILNMYPPALRRAAEVALGLEDEDARVTDLEPWGKSSTPTTGARGQVSAADTPAALLESRETRKPRTFKTRQTARLLEFRRKETQRILKLMRATQSDLQLWHLLEKHVFSMVQCLGIAERGISKESDLDKRPALDMDKWGPLYSVHLLNGLRCLDRNFATPSPLALNILPRIMELGMASYVLGVSTTFYNEAMSIYWHRHGDLNNVVRLLQDMESSGLGADRETVKLIDSMLASIDTFARPGATSPFASVMKTTPLCDQSIASRLERLREWAVNAVEDEADRMVWY